MQGINMVPPVRLASSRQRKEQPAKGRGSEAGGQPGFKIVSALEIEQGFRQRLELLQGKGLDAGSGGLAQGAAAAGEKADGDGGFSFFAPLLTARVWRISSREMPAITMICSSVSSGNRCTSSGYWPAARSVAAGSGTSARPAGGESPGRGASALPAAPPGQSTPSRRWFSSLSSGASKR